MGDYIEPIKWGVLLFPFIAALFTIPYVLIQYRKYGSIPFLRVLIVYSFILYLICAYFLVILPLPSRETVAALTTPTMQLQPFMFISDFLNNTSLVITEPSTYLKALSEPWFYQVVYNVLLFVPFGLYLRYYFKCSFLKTLVLSFLLSLFFELTQLSGLYGFYERSYRLFDVDDLMINTLGGIVGFVTAGIVLKILPNRDELDNYAYKKGTQISGVRRLVNFILDIFIYMVFANGFYAILHDFIDFKTLSLIVLIIYYVLIPWIFKGQTLGKKFLRMKIVYKDRTPNIYHYLFRYFLLFFVVFELPFYLIFILALVGNLIPDGFLTLVYSLGLIVSVIFVFLYYFIIIVHLFKGRELWYEKVSHTKNISTIEYPLEKEEVSEETNKTVEIPHNKSV